jgi:ABC-type bacteriocin/lantibiotic exporter with double-glycine peptidase domain
VNNNNYRQFLIKYAKSNKLVLFFGLLLSLISIGFQLVLPYPLKFLTDVVFGSSDVPKILQHIDRTQILYIGAAMYLVLYLLSNIYDVVVSVATTRIHQHIDKKVFTDLMNNVLYTGYNNPNRRDSGTYLYQATEIVTSVRSIIFDSTIAGVSSLISLVSVTGILLVINPLFAVSAFLVLIPLGLSIKYFGKRIEGASISTQVNAEQYYNHLTETVEKVRISQLFSAESNRLGKVLTALQNTYKSTKKETLLNSLFSNTNDTFTAIAVSVMIIAGGLAIRRGSMTYGDLLLFITYMGMLYEPLMGLFGLVAVVKSQLVGVKALHETDIVNKSQTDGTKEVVNLGGSYVFKEVDLSFGAKVVFDKASFEILKGDFVIIVGPSGSGKSSILQMLMGYLKPDLGQITVDGVLLYDIIGDSYRRNFSVVDQEPVLFSDSIEDNISISDSNRSTKDVDVASALSVSNIKTYVDSLKEGSSTRLGDINLSGGQKQRMAIARAIYKHANVLFLDEPTSALDGDSKNEFAKLVTQVLPGRTVIMVTHDESFAPLASLIIRLQDGKAILQRQKNPAN